MNTANLGVLWLIITCLAVCALIFSMRYLRTRENLAMLEKGFDPKLKPVRPRPAPFVNLKWGLLLMGAGVGLFFAYLLDHTVLYSIGHDIDRFSHEGELNGANVPIYFAMIAIGGGLGLITSYRIEKKELLDKEAR